MTISLSHTELRERALALAQQLQQLFDSRGCVIQYREGHLDKKVLIEASDTILRLLDENEHEREHHTAEMKAAEAAFNTIRDDRNRLRDEKAALVKERDGAKACARYLKTCLRQLGDNMNDAFDGRRSAHQAAHHAEKEWPEVFRSPQTTP